MHRIEARRTSSDAIGRSMAAPSSGVPMRDLLVVVVPLVRAGVGGGPSTPFCTATRRRDGSKLVRLIVSGPGPSGLWVRRRGSTANDEGDKGESRERERQGLEKRRREAREVDRDEQATQRASKLIPKHPKIRARIYTVPKGRKDNPIRFRSHLLVGCPAPLSAHPHSAHSHLASPKTDS